ncbi:ATP-grasp domain-containing protein [Streptomyces sampsonii]|uniref:ATP-grasp domain-containing protein n=1 Tax=Streptomyces albidoflavus TaxID=1886 RepID=UPI001020C6C6|nr:ATP-grasp domain-containing protein [Streptomyces albidoflavus]MBO1285794.1 ATP-grasp domain-containing protein [Streptomyces sampsonii]RZD57636.1 phosphoribosylglycinamide synthetase [Streptomyces albidoflavus]
MQQAHIILVGSGGQPYRDYAFRSLAGRYRLSALLPADPTWQQPHLQDWRTADLTDPDAVTGALKELADDGSAVLTWDETVLEVTAEAAGRLGLHHMSARSAQRCRDKYLTRRLLDEAGLPAVRHGLAHTAREAEEIAARLGFPVVVKPRALAGSVGVVRVEEPDAVAAAFELAGGAGYATLPNGHGILVEEFLDGPEISVDSAVLDGEVSCVQVAAKRLGYAPHFEETGHLVKGWDGTEPWADEVHALVTAAHTALGVEAGVTHAEVRLTSRGPRLVELNGRLGGDLIPYAGQLATGVDLVRAAAAVALRERPDLTPTRALTTEVRFVYPPHDGRVAAVSVGRAAELPGVAHAATLVAPGDTLLLPPRQPIPRLAVLIAEAADEAGCAEVLARALPEVTSEVVPLTGEPGR